MSEDQQVIFQERINKLMKERGVSPGTVANRMNTTDHTIRNYMRGKSFPCAQNLRDLAQVFCVTTDYLLGISEERK